MSDGLTLDLTNSHLRTLADVPLAPALTVSVWLRSWLGHCWCSVLQRLCHQWLIHVQALDLTANRLTGLEPNLLALTGCLFDLSAHSARTTSWRHTAASDSCFTVSRIEPHSSSQGPSILWC